MKKQKSKTSIEWSIHFCKKVEIEGKLGSMMTGYMTVQTIGRKKENVMHNTLGAALKHVGV